MKDRIIWLCIIIVVCMVFTSSSTLWACTSFKVTAEDNSVVIGRSLEFGTDPESSVIYAPRGKKHTGTTPDGGEGMSWTSKYASLYMDGFGFDSPVDGLNEAGLAIAALYMPGYKVYPDTVSGEKEQTISSIEFTQWLLDSFASTEEVKKTLPSITVWGAEVPSMNEVMPAHYIVYDAAGNGLVIEYINGKLNMYDNPLGVLTNAPTFPWHMTNLRNYVNLSKTGNKEFFLKDMKIERTGQGTGLIGLPGDQTPPSRFIRAAVLASWGEGAKEADSAVILAVHILNALDIPDGIAGNKDGEKTFYDFTRWATVKDLTNLRYFYRTYDNPSMRMVDLRELAKSDKRRSYPISTDGTKPWNNVTDN